MLLLAPSLSAFTLNFAGLVGQTIPSTLTVTVPGYGDVRIDAPAASPVAVGDLYGAPAIQLAPGQQIVVSFLGGAVTEFDSLDLGLDGEELFVTNFFSGINVGTFTLDGEALVPGGGITAITFNAAAVPETSSAMLGLLGVTGLILRRRR